MGIALTVAAGAQAADLKISHVRPQGATVDKDIHALADAVNKATDGDLNLRVFAANALGDYTVVQERISVGAVDMAVQPAATAADRRMQIGLFPYLAKNYDDARKIFGPGGPVREAMEKLYAKQDITVLAAYPVYFGGIALNTEPVSPGDPTADKGIKLRVPPIKAFQLLADDIGYIGSPLPFSEAFTAVQTGVVDGVIGSGAEGYYASFRDVTDYYIPLNTHFEIWYLIINSQSFDDLSGPDRKALQAAASDFESERWDAAKADQAANEQRLADNGTKIVSVSDAQRAANAKQVRADVWPQLLEDVGKQWGGKILDAARAAAGE
jgi:TRAP-type C4-dicarboxylate transport system substrate-binding protein